MLICLLLFICFLSSSKKKIACLTFYAFYAFCVYKKHLRESCLFTFCAFCAYKKRLSESCLFAICAYKKTCKSRSLVWSFCALQFVRIKTSKWKSLIWRFCASCAFYAFYAFYAFFVRIKKYLNESRSFAFYAHKKTSEWKSLVCFLYIFVRAKFSREKDMKLP